MAKYTVTHNCGHAQVHDLFGPGKDRERKISWLATTECKDCWIKTQRAERDAAPITAEVICNIYTGDGKSAYILVTGGNTYPIKDTLKAAGCYWMDYVTNNDLLGMTKPRKAWGVKVNPDNVTETSAIAQRLIDAGVIRIDDTLNPLSLALVKQLNK